MSEAFEKWLNHPKALERFSGDSVGSGRYVREDVQMQWQAWQAAIASLEPAFWIAPESLPMDRPADHIYVTNEEADGCCVPVYVIKK